MLYCKVICFTKRSHFIFFADLELRHVPSSNLPFCSDKTDINNNIVVDAEDALEPDSDYYVAQEDPGGIVQAGNEQKTRLNMLLFTYKDRFAMFLKSRFYK